MRLPAELEVACDDTGQPRRVGHRELPDDAALRRAVARHDLAGDAVAAVLARYRERGRWYHAAWHPADLFHRAERVGWALDRAQVLALLYHDAVYVPGAPAGTNEALSVLVLRQAAYRHGWPAADVDPACAMIEDTAGHRPRGPRSLQVVALDLATLADDADGFDGWTELVWREYRHLFADERDPRAAFLRRRLGVLRSLHAACQGLPMPPDFQPGFSANLARLAEALGT